MNTALILILVAGAATNVVLLLALLVRSSSNRAFATEVREDLRAGREELRSSSKEANESLAGGVRVFTEIGRALDARVKDLQVGTEAKLEASRGVLDRIRDTVDGKLNTVAEGNQAALERIRSTFDTRVEELKLSLDARVKEMQDSNERKLEEMRQTVDEKLQGTLEKRLGESFKFVSDRLEMVHKGLGEMQGLATGVGDLKRIFSNVKVRGTWAEVQLGGILEQMLTLDQWDKNVCVKEGSAERVECAIRLPGSRDDRGRCMWLPIDSKFPTEDYARLQSAAEGGDSDAVQAAVDALMRTLKSAAKDIHDKYVNPPATTDYAIMFLATEGLYGEVLRQPQVVEEILQKYRVVIAGPTTLSAIVSSLRMGFQTLVVEQRAAEVWRVLGAVKTEFGKFGSVLDRVQRQLLTASRTIEETGTRTRAMERRLRAVEQMDPEESATILALPLPAEVDREGGDAAGKADDELPGAA
ncbi:MAG TPA: DNA recombination protein RmuC [Steroidobacteraceae bacterium]|nr:DNA recombination protein RmuC [Steroidobacteraceae bacterium]